jgi:hypothetical protein
VGLSELRCPECGRPFEADLVKEAPFRNRLLAWERPECGGVARRTLLALSDAGLHPNRFFARARTRIERRIANPTLFIMSCVLASFALHFGGRMLAHVVNFAFLAARYGQIRHAASTTAQIAAWSVRTDWLTPSIQVSTTLIAAFISAGVMSLLFRRRAGSLRFVDFAALLAPIVTISASLMVVGNLILTLWFDTIIVVVYGTAIAQTVVLGIMVWYCCRHLLAICRVRAVGIVILCVLLSYLSERPIVYGLVQLELALLPTSFTMGAQN